MKFTSLRDKELGGSLVYQMQQTDLIQFNIYFTIKTISKQIGMCKIFIIFVQGIYQKSSQILYLKIKILEAFPLKKLRVKIPAIAVSIQNNISDGVSRITQSR